MVRHTRRPDDGIEKKCPYCGDIFAEWGGYGTHIGRMHKGMPFEKHRSPKKSPMMGENKIK